MEQQPGWPPAAARPAAPSFSGGPARPTSMTTAGIFLIVLGVPVGLIGLLAGLAGLAFPSIRSSPEIVDQLGALPEGLGIFMLVLGVVLLAWGVTEVLAGAFVMQRRGWARIAGIVVGILGTLAGISLSLPNQAGVNYVALVIGLLFGGGHAYAVWVLVRGGDWFTPGELPPPA
jgi:uncharacterized membrane protein HdeD (DUF308 family)